MEKIKWVFQLTIEPFPIISFDKLLMFILNNLDKPIIYTLISLTTEILLFKISFKESKYIKLSFISNLISTPLAWFSLTVIFLPLIYSLLITTTQITTLSEWKFISIIYALASVIIYIFFTSFIEYLIAESLKIKGESLIGVFLISNFISLTVILSVLSLIV